MAVIQGPWTGTPLLNFPPQPHPLAAAPLNGVAPPQDRFDGGAGNIPIFQPTPGMLKAMMGQTAPTTQPTEGGSTTQPACGTPPSEWGNVPIFDPSKPMNGLAGAAAAAQLLQAQLRPIRPCPSIRSLRAARPRALWCFATVFRKDSKALSTATW